MLLFSTRTLFYDGHTLLPRRQDDRLFSADITPLLLRRHGDTPPSWRAIVAIRHFLAHYCCRATPRHITLQRQNIGCHTLRHYIMPRSTKIIYAAPPPHITYIFITAPCHITPKMPFNITLILIMILWFTIITHMPPYLRRQHHYIATHFHAAATRRFDETLCTEHGHAMHDIFIIFIFYDDIDDVTTCCLFSDINSHFSARILLPYFIW